MSAQFDAALDSREGYSADEIEIFEAMADMDEGDYNADYYDEICPDCGQRLDSPNCWCDGQALNDWDGQPDEAQEWYDFDPDC